MSGADSLLLVTTSYPRWTDGREAAGSFVADLAAELAKHVPVRVVAPGDTVVVEEVAPRLTIYRYPAPKRRLVNLRLHNPRDAWRILATLWAGRAAVRRAVRDGRVQHTLALWALPPGQWARSAARKFGVPYSVWMLGSDVWSLGRMPVVRRVLRGVMRDASYRYADGLQLARASEHICGCPTRFLPTTRALQTDNVPPSAATPPYRLVFIGRWHRNKGVDLLLDALALLDNADWARIGEVAIYGGGPLGAQVSAKSQVLIAAGRPLVVGGFIPKADAEAAIVRADYVIIPSRIESIPVVFSDAMKLGRPVIATPVGDLPVLLADMTCGVLAAEVNAPALARALHSALEASPRAFAGGVSAMAARFDLKAIAGSIVADAAGLHGG